MPKAVIQIEYDTDTGKLGVAAPMQQKGLCYMMLELTKDLVRETHAKQVSDSGIVLPPGRMVDFPSNGDGH